MPRPLLRSTIIMIIRQIILLALILLSSSKQLFDESIANQIPNTVASRQAQGSPRARDLEEIEKMDTPQQKEQPVDAEKKDNQKQTEKGTEVHLEQNQAKPPSEAEKDSIADHQQPTHTPAETPKEQHTEQPSSQSQATSQPQPNAQDGTAKADKFDSVDYFGDITSSLKSLLKNSQWSGGQFDKDVIKKIVESVGIADPGEVKEEYEAYKNEEKAKEQEEAIFQQKLSQWVKKEKESSQIVKQKVASEEVLLERFEFTLEEESNRKLYMNVPPGRPENYLFHIAVYWQVEQNFTTPNNPTQQQFLDLEIVHRKKSVYKEKIYVQKTFEWSQYLQNGNIQLSFTNKLSHSILVLVNLQRLKTIPSTLKQKQIDPIAQKLKRVIDNTQLVHSSNMFRSKAEIGFKQREQSVMAEMLVFAGVECLVLFIVMLTQLYFLQKLINNNSIMV